MYLSSICDPSANAIRPCCWAAPFSAASASYASILAWVRSAWSACQTIFAWLLLRPAIFATVGLPVVFDQQLAPAGQVGHEHLTVGVAAPGLPISTVFQHRHPGEDDVIDLPVGAVHGDHGGA